MEQKYYKVREVAQIFGLKPAVVRNYCHARGQNFAYQIVRNGNIYIDLSKFSRWFETRKTEGTIR